MIINDETNEIIGINMIGPQVTELINEASLLQFMNGSAIELGLTTHASFYIRSTYGIGIESRK